MTDNNKRKLPQECTNIEEVRNEIDNIDTDIIKLLSARFGYVREVVKYKEKTASGIGFNAVTNEYVDMIKAGIVDPAKVTRSALQNAASIASMVLTTETLIADKPEKEAPMPAGAPGMGGMPGMM